MLLPIVLKSWLQRATFGSVLIALISIATPASSQSTGIDPDHQKTATPIKHVIVLIGENRTFDHVFATYMPRGRDSVQNLLSEGIINANGSPVWNVWKAAQFQAVPPFKTEYFISLDRNGKVRYRTLPQPTSNFAPVAPTFPAGTPASLLAAVEPSLDANDLNLLTTGLPASSPRPFFCPIRIPCEFQLSAERAVSTQGKKPGVRFLHRGYNPPALRDVATVRLQHPERHATEPFGLLKRSLSLRDHQLHQHY